MKTKYDMNYLLMEIDCNHVLNEKEGKKTLESQIANTKGVHSD